MHKSPSRVDIDDLATLKENGGDLSSYKQQLTRERNARSLSLRRMNRPTIAGVFGGSANLREGKRPRISLSDTKQSTIDSALAILNGGVESQIQTFCNEIINADANNLSTVSILSKSSDVAIAISAALQNDLSESTILSILGALSIIFPLAKDNVNVYIDEGICFLLLNLLESDSANMVSAAVTFIGIVADSSGYARDSLLCLEMHFNLVQIATQTDSEEICAAACDSLLKIFSNQQEIDLQVLQDAVTPMAPLLEISSNTALHSVIAAFTEMACKMQTLVLAYHEIGLFNKALEFLQNTELTDVSLKLVGILSIGQPSHVRQMLDDGLLDILNSLLSTEYTADVFWVFSNLVETLQGSITPVFDAAFLDSAIESSDSSFEVKKEAAYFLATFALFADSSQLEQFLRQDAFDLLVEMLGCGVSMIIVRIIDCIVRILHQAQGGIPEVVAASDLRVRLGEILDTAASVVADRVSYLLQNLDAIEGAE